jgi:hypothetical protein
MAARPGQFNALHMMCHITPLNVGRDRDVPLWDRATCHGVCPDNPASPNRRRTRVKTYDIEVQRLKSMKHDKGLIELGIDVLVLPRPVRDDGPATSCLRLPVEHARSLLILLKQQLAELDKLQPRSRRSGRC